MPLTRTYRPSGWPYATLNQLSALGEELNRLFDLSTRAGLRPNDSLQSWMPPLDLRETPDAFIATLELPGMKREQIEVSVHEGVLSVSGERLPSEPAEGCSVFRSERPFGRFQRSVSLPKPVQADATKATYRDGILTVTLPKAEEAKPKQIEVSVG